MDILYSGPEITLLHFSSLTVEKEWCYTNVISPFYRIYYVTKGKASLFIKGKWNQLTPEKMYIVPAFTPHSYRCSETMSHYYLHFFLEPQNHNYLFQNISMCFEIDITPLRKLLFERLAEVLPNYGIKNNQDPKDYQSRLHADHPTSSLPFNLQMEVCSIINQLLSGFIQKEHTFYHTSDGNGSIIQQAITVMMQLPFEDLNVSAIAQLIGKSPDYFSRKFKKELGVTPQQFIAKKRIDKTLLLLATTNKSNAEIADEIGLSSESAFVRFFRREIGFSPAYYRKHRMYK